MYWRILPHAVVALALMVGLAAPAHAAPSLAEIQAKVRFLEEEATTAAEGAQEAKVKLIALTRTLNGIKAKAAVQGETLSALQKSLGTIAIEQYKAGGLGQSLELLFSSDPTLYLSSAGALDAISRRKSAQLRKYEAAQQRLSATTLTVNDKLALAKRAQARFLAQEKEVKSKLAAAQKLFNSLSKAERERLARLNSRAESADKKKSLATAARSNLGSGRGSMALRFSIKQIGDRYVYGAAGPTLWDCSGLTMRAFGGTNNSKS